MPDVSFAELATAAYCPRQLYYRRREGDWTPPPGTGAVRELAFHYDRLLAASDEVLRAAPLAVEPGTWRANVRAARRRLDAWPALAAPAERDRRLEGRDCRGVAHKVLADPPGVSLVSPGEPPTEGAWEPHRVRAVATALALAWERQAAVDLAVVEYPAHGVVRRVPLDGRRRAEYRRTLRTVRTLDGVPPRLTDDARCGACDYRTTCGVRTRTLTSLLG